MVCNVWQCKFVNKNISALLGKNINTLEPFFINFPLNEMKNFK